MSNEEHPIAGHSYAIQTGTFVGEIFVFIEEKDNQYCFISIPKNINRIVPKDKFVYGLNTNIVEYVEKIKSKPFNLLKKQYTFNTENAK